MESLLRRALATYATLYREESPLYSALCSGLSESPNRIVTDLFGRFFRILSTDQIDIPLFLGAVHHLALSGTSPELAAFFPSCGGSYDPSQGEALIAAVEEAIRTGYDDALDFMLSQQPVTDDPALSALTLIGAASAHRYFGGPLALVDVGAGGGFRLLFDQYSYRFGPQRIGHSPLCLELALEGRWETLAMPPVTERVGLEAHPRDMTNPDDLRFVVACLPPDQRERIDRLRAAAAWMAAAGRPDLREGHTVTDLAPLLTEVYNRMAPGTTLFLAETLHWSTLSPEEQKQLAFTVQSLAAQIQPHKPIAWFQADRFTPGAPHLELRLHTFGWADPEDRDVIRLGSADRHLRWVRLTEG